MRARRSKSHLMCSGKIPMLACWFPLPVLRGSAKIVLEQGLSLLITLDKDIDVCK